MACAALLAGCAARTNRVAPAPPASESTDYIDLEPGWRLHVVTPISKSGGYQLQTTGQDTAGGSITISAQDFIGFETAYYSVSNAPEGAIRIEFVSATITKGEQTTAQTQPLVPLFDLPAGVRFVRLVYLTRSSQADHDMALIAADQNQTMDARTREVLANPGNCANLPAVHCSWIPAGIAVRPELRKPGSSEWIPAR